MYSGTFRIELYPSAKTDIAAAAGATIDGRTIRVYSGTFQQVMGGLQFYNNGKPFGFGYSVVKKVVESDGNTLWVNWDENEKRK